MKLVAYWVGLTLAILAAQWLYQPSLELAGIASAVMIPLAALVGWSATRFGSGVMGVVKTLVVSGVAGFMFTQAMDIAYSALAAPAGGRLDALFETATAAILLTATSSLLRVISPGPEVEKKSSGD